MARRPPGTPSRPPAPGPRPPNVAFEPNDLRAGSVFGWIIGLLVALALIFVAVSVLFLGVLGTGPALSIPPAGVGISQTPPTPLPPQPQLETQPGVTADFVRSREEPVLNSYRYLDKSKGIVQIPIDQAINVLAQKGLPARPANQQTTAEKDTQIPSYSSSGTMPEAFTP